MPTVYNGMRNLSSRLGNFSFMQEYIFDTDCYVNALISYGNNCGLVVCSMAGTFLKQRRVRILCLKNGTELVLTYVCSELFMYCYVAVNV